MLSGVTHALWDLYNRMVFTAMGGMIICIVTSLFYMIITQWDQLTHMFIDIPCGLLIGMEMTWCVATRLPHYLVVSEAF